jgi:hypothetical protein
MAVSQISNDRVVDDSSTTHTTSDRPYRQARDATIAIKDFATTRTQSQILVTSQLIQSCDMIAVSAAITRDRLSNPSSRSGARVELGKRAAEVSQRKVWCRGHANGSPRTESGPAFKALWATEFIFADPNSGMPRRRVSRSEV